MKKNDVNNALVNVIRKTEEGAINYTQGAVIVNASDKIIKNEIAQLKYNKEMMRPDTIEYFE